MTPMSFAETVDAVAASHSRLLAAVSKLDDDQLHQPSDLLGWTRGHVLAHVARSGDAVNRLAAGVLEGTTPDMYPGGPDGRAAAIEEGADRPLALVIADLTFSSERVVRSLQQIPEDALSTTVKWRKPVSAADLPRLRWREVEIHHADLLVGYTPLDWPDEFVESTLGTELPELDQRAPGVVVPDLPRAELLAWLVGRPTRSGLPELPAWP